MSATAPTISPENLFFHNLAARTAPFARLGNSLLAAARFATADADMVEVEASVIQQLTDLQRQFDQLRASIATELEDENVIIHAGKILAIKDLLDEYARTHAQQNLTDAQSQSGEEKRIIMGLLNSRETSDEFFHIYGTLFCMLISLRVSCFVLLRLSRPDLYAQVCEELNDVLRYRDHGIEIARQIGRNRVSPVRERRFLVDELGPVWGTTFTIMVDGRVVYTDEFAANREVPRRDISEVREQAHAMRDTLAERLAATVSEPLRTFYTNVDTLKPIVCGA